MSRPQEPHRPFLPFGNPFRRISPKGSYLSPKLLALLNTFEETLAGRIKKLKPAGKEDVLRLSWMRYAMETLCEIHTDIKALITSLELPVSDWDEKWIDVYLDDSVKLLDICIAFSSEISQLKQGNLFLQCVLHNLGHDSNQSGRAHSSLEGWSKHIASKNPRFGNCFSAMDELEQKLDLPKIKNSSKGKVLMRAMYGVKVVTLLVCRIFAAGLSGSSKKLVDVNLPEAFFWAAAFTDLQTFVNTEIRIVYSGGKTTTVLKELEDVGTCVKKLSPIVQDAAHNVDAEILKGLTLDLGKSAEKLTLGLDELAKEVDGFFRIVLTGRDALLGNLRVGGEGFDRVGANKKVGSSGSS